MLTPRFRIYPYHDQFTLSSQYNRTHTKPLKPNTCIHCTPIAIISPTSTLLNNLLQGVSASRLHLSTVLAVPDPHSLPLHCELQQTNSATNITTTSSPTRNSAKPHPLHYANKAKLFRTTCPQHDQSNRPPNLKHPNPTPLLVSCQTVMPSKVTTMLRF